MKETPTYKRVMTYGDYGIWESKIKHATYKVTHNNFWLPGMFFSYDGAKEWVLKRIDESVKPNIEYKQEDVSLSLIEQLQKENQQLKDEIERIKGLTHYIELNPKTNLEID